jgi:hypothetical protein
MQGYSPAARGFATSNTEEVGHRHLHQSATVDFGTPSSEAIARKLIPCARISLAVARSCSVARALGPAARLRALSRAHAVRPAVVRAARPDSWPVDNPFRVAHRPARRGGGGDEDFEAPSSWVFAIFGPAYLLGLWGDGGRPWRGAIACTSSPSARNPTRGGYTRRGDFRTLTDTNGRPHRG